MRTKVAPYQLVIKVQEMEELKSRSAFRYDSTAIAVVGIGDECAEEAMENAEAEVGSKVHCGHRALFPGNLTGGVNCRLDLRVRQAVL